MVFLNGLGIEKAIKDFIFHCQYEKNLNKKTINAYNIDLKQFALYLSNIPFIGEKKIITKDDIKNYLCYISKFKPKTIKRKIATLKAMFTYLEYEDESFINLFRKIKINIKEPYLLPIVMTISEVSKILNVVYKEEKETVNPTSYHQKELIRNITVLELLFATGIRVSELCSLKVKDVDLKNWTIKVFGKGSKERVIQICEQEVKVLLKKCFTLYRPDNENVNCFFINRVGAPLSTQSVRLMIHKYVKQAGLEKRITPHTFRHTFATLLLEEDVDIRYIQNLLGHSTITTTQIYTHVNSEKQKKILATKHPRRKLSFS